MSCPQGIKRDSCEKVLWQWEVPVAYVRSPLLAPWIWGGIRRRLATAYPRGGNGLRLSLSLSLFFSLSIVDLQYSVSFLCTEKCFRVFFFTFLFYPGV